MWRLAFVFKVPGSTLGGGNLKLISLEGLGAPSLLFMEFPGSILLDCILAYFPCKLGGERSLVQTLEEAFWLILLDFPCKERSLPPLSHWFETWWLPPLEFHLELILRSPR